MKLKTQIITFSICIFVLLCINTACAGKNMPHGWRIATNSEIQYEDDEWRNSDKNKYLLVEGDFNGDCVIDEARLLISKKNPLRLGLFAFVSQKNGTFKTFLLDETDNPRYFKALGIKKVLPGEYLTVCGKGIMDCEPDQPDKVLLLYEGINFFKRGGASMYFYWDPLTKDFKKAYIDD